MRTANIACILAFLLYTAACPSFAESTVQPIPEKVDVDPLKVKIGEQLFHDKRLSVDGSLSCASCHMLHKGGVDGAETSLGIKGQKGPINSPSVYNAAHNFVQFWDGRAKDLKEQALGPVENPLEMGESWENVVKKITADPKYVKEFKQLNGGVITKETIADAIAEFEKTLITPGSRFDQFLLGDKNVLTPEEQKGYQLFQEKGCTACHSGSYFGGQFYQRLNPDYYKDRGIPITTADLGRFNVTKNEADKYFFKVPMLRNIAVTGPYFHDGKLKTLDEAIYKMGKYQLGQELTPKEVKAIAAFLRSLTGTYKGVPLDKMKESEQHSSKN